MPYIPDATDTTNPIDGVVKAATAAAEFRTLKLYLRDVVLPSIAAKSPLVTPTFTGATNVYSGAVGTFALLNVGRTASEARVAVVANNNELLANTQVADALFYNVSGGRALFGTAGAHAALFITNNAERFRIDSSGNIGIGTSSIGARLDIRGATPQLLDIQNTGGVGAQIRLFDTGFSAGVGTVNGDLIFGAGGHAAERLRIKTTGGVVFTPTNAPASPSLGEIYYDNITNKHYGWNGSWNALY